MVIGAPNYWFLEVGLAWFSFILFLSSYLVIGASNNWFLEAGIAWVFLFIVFIFSLVYRCTFLVMAIVWSRTFFLSVIVSDYPLVIQYRLYSLLGFLYHTIIFFILYFVYNFLHLVKDFRGILYSNS